jgi:hypothetical protein
MDDRETKRRPWYSGVKAWQAALASLFLLCAVLASLVIVSMRREIAALRSTQASASSKAAEETQALGGRVADLETGQKASNDRLAEVESRTEGIGYRKLAWSYKGIPGASSLEVIARAAKGRPDHCAVRGAFEYSNRGLLPTSANVAVTRKGGENVLQTKVDLSPARFEIEVPTTCDGLDKVNVTR